MMRLFTTLLLALLAAPASAGTVYIDTGGATTNSGSTDGNTAPLSGTGDAVVTGTTVQLTIPTDLSGVVITAGATQSSIYIAQATNTSQKIFWITGKDDGLDQVTVSVAPTGVTASNWAIGGRMVFTLANFSAALRGGDTVIFNNSPAAQSATLITTAVAGDNTGSYIKWIGKTGVRPVLNATSTNAAISSTGHPFNWFENLELDQDGATGSGINLAGQNLVAYNLKIVDAGSSGGILSGAQTNHRIVNCDISGSAGAGIADSSSAAGLFISGNYIHDNTTDGITLSAAPIVTIQNNIIDSNAGHGIYMSGAVTANTNSSVITGNTIYGNGDSGLEVTDIDNPVNITNNIFVNNGNAAGEYNVEFVSGSAEIAGVHGWNIFYENGAGDNLLNLTANATESTADPLLNSPAAGDFTLQTSSPALDVGFPGQLLGATGQGYRDIGAQEKQQSAGGAAAGGFIIGGN